MMQSGNTVAIEKQQYKMINDVQYAVNYLINKDHKWNK